MNDHSISILALQEPMLFANAPPLNLDPALYQQHSTAGIRGLITKPAQSWLNSLSLPNVSTSDFWHWITLHSALGIIHIANCYFPPNHDEKNTTHAALNLLGQQILSIKSSHTATTNAHFILCGDFNADPLPHKMHGHLAASLATFIPAHRLFLAPRPHRNSHTRPASRTHIDLFILSDTLRPFLTQSLEYLYDNKIGASTYRAPSDHIPIILTLTNFSPKISYTKHINVNVQPLRDGHTHQYASTLHTLTHAWFAWRQRLIVNGCNTSLLRVMWAGLNFIIHEAAFLVHGHSVTKRYNDTVSFLCSKPLPQRLDTKAWQFIQKQQCAQQPTVPQFSVTATLNHMKSIGNCIPHPLPSISELVSSQLLRLRNLPPLSASDQIRLIQEWTPIISNAAQALSNGTAAGATDRIPPELPKHAPPAYFAALATLATDCSSHLYFPDDLQKGVMSYIHKGKSLPHTSLAYFRGLRVTSVPGKLIAKAVAHPIFSATATFNQSIRPEQFAGRRKHSADLLALVLQFILCTHATNPLYLILLDIAKAFDTVWRDALWAKLLSQGHRPQHVAWLRALYDKLLTAVKGIMQFQPS